MSITHSASHALHAFQRLRLAGSIALALFIALQPASVLASETISMSAYVSKDTNKMGRFSYLVYVEAFRRLGLTLDYVEYPASRASVVADQGQVAGELVRSEEYGATHPNLVRVPESPFGETVAAYAVNPQIKLHGWESLRGTDYRVDYRLGYILFEKRLKTVGVLQNATAVKDIDNGLSKLLANHADIFIDGEPVVDPMLATEKFSGTGIHNAGVLERLELYAYFNKKYQDLAPKLAAVLRQMKKEGLIERYRAQAFGQ